MPAFRIGRNSAGQCPRTEISHSLWMTRASPCSENGSFNGLLMVFPRMAWRRCSVHSTELLKKLRLKYSVISGNSEYLIHTGARPPQASPKAVRLPYVTTELRLPWPWTRKGTNFHLNKLAGFIAAHYVLFLVENLFPDEFILSAERFGISLFYRELDFTKNELVDFLQKIVDDKKRNTVSPYLIIERGTSRYALPIKDNIDYTRKHS